MAISEAALEQVIDAFNFFDRDHRNRNEWVGWETKQKLKKSLAAAYGSRC